MGNDESNYDIEKGIMAAYMKKTISGLSKPSRQKSMNKIFDKWKKKFDNLSEADKKHINDCINKNKKE